MTVATAWTILHGRPFQEAYLDFGRRYPRAGIAHAYYNRIADDIVTEVRQKLPQEFLETIDRYEATFGSAGRRERR